MKKEKGKGKHIGLRIDDELHKKLVSICGYEGRSINGQLLYLIRRCVSAFEKAHGQIETERDP